MCFYSKPSIRRKVQFDTDGEEAGALDTIIGTAAHLKVRLCVSISVVVAVGAVVKYICVIYYILCMFSCRMPGSDDRRRNAPCASLRCGCASSDLFGNLLPASVRSLLTWTGSSAFFSRQGGFCGIITHLTDHA